ncbi:hypothetical protein [Nostoc sp. ChiQUE01b]|uniref:hypothetical protein n=1 Tax=Nostoc sp. ChiQUE01b TaxID=3075376 RepID=UPI002AD213C6|nr:hypothetical protein [Nostoc sp. ChiQUE01b]MDZ8257984.1 hypothetical protein [Nostoc sp. ChiQUE01b]
MLGAEIMYSIGAYQVPVTTQANTSIQVSLKPAKKEDMIISDKWSFNWKELWEKTDFEYQNIIKLSYKDNILGFIKYAVYVSEENIPYALEVLQLESVPKSTRQVAPIGQWLLWYVSQVALSFCTLNENDEVLVYLDSLEEAIPYYKDIIKMEPKGWVTIAPGEDGYAFQFTVTGARDFCERQTNTYGHSQRIYS